MRYEFSAKSLWGLPQSKWTVLGEIAEEEITIGFPDGSAEYATVYHQVNYDLTQEDYDYFQQCILDMDMN